MAAPLNEVLAEDLEVRLVDAVVDELDLRKLGFTRVDAAETGRPGYAPGDLLKLYVYGYMNQIRSSRRLEREARRNIEVHWLIDRLRPSFKTIADFRRDHPMAIVAVCCAFVDFCARLSLIEGQTVAIDGSKVQAAASRKKVLTPELLEKRRQALEEKIKAHLKAMDEADAAEESESPPVDVRAGLAALEAEKQRINEQAQELKASGLGRMVEGEPEARLMRTPNHGKQVSYNVQIGVDVRHKLVASFDVTNAGNDHGQLYGMAEKTRIGLGVGSLTVVADVGYSNGLQAERCEGSSITPIVPRPETVNPQGRQFLSRDDFSYDPQTDTYRCPDGRTLSRFKLDRERGKADYRTADCSGCELKSRCTNASRRTVVRSLHEDAREAMHQRATREWMDLRKATVEHPFGTMKAMMGNPRFLLRGIRKASAEWALLVLGYNLKRARTILGTTALIGAIAARA